MGARAGNIQASFPRGDTTTRTGTGTDTRTCATPRSGAGAGTTTCPSSGSSAATNLAAVSAGARASCGARACAGSSSSGGGSGWVRAADCCVQGRGPGEPTDFELCCPEPVWVKWVLLLCLVFSRHDEQPYI